MPIKYYNKIYLEMRTCMKIVICDDRAEDREILARLLKDYKEKRNQNFEIIEYSSGIELYRSDSILQACQLVFLDINMMDMDGLKVAMKIKKKYPKIFVVLVTAYMNYALDGYKVKASRFLLKDELTQTINECMDDLMNEIHQSRQEIKFSFVEGSMTLRIEDIIYIETAKHKNLFYTTDGIFSIYQKLDEIELCLEGLGFLRVHQSFLVNMRYIQKMSSYILILKNGKELSVPKSRYKEAKKQYALFKGAE